MNSIKEIKAIDLYLSLSLISAMMLFSISGFFADVLNYDHFFFSVTMCVGSFLMFRDLYGKSFLFQRTSVYASVFFFQIFCLVGYAFETESVGGFYLALIPAMMGQYYAQRVDHSDSLIRQRTGVGFFAVSMLCIISLQAFYPVFQSLGREFAVWSVFLFWSIGSLYSRTNFFSLMSGKVMSLISSEKLRHDHIDRDRSDRLFFHDVINQTHGINLFLSSRISRGEGITSQQCRDLLSEMRIIQAQVKDHYKFDHKNLVNSYEFVSISSIRKWIDRAVVSFLPPDLVESSISYVGIDLYSGQIHYPSFTRIFTNIIKNVSEVKTHEVWVNFECQADGILFSVRNLLFDPSIQANNMEKKLREQILFSERNPIVQGESGLGLESIYRLCLEQGGNFEFFLQDGYWVNKVYLPYVEQSVEVKRVA